jgi:hypothetical protein
VGWPVIVIVGGIEVPPPPPPPQAAKKQVANNKTVYRISSSPMNQKYGGDESIKI